MTGSGRSQSDLILLLILATTTLRLLFGTALGLGVDESYMVAAGRVPGLGYYDHPPAAWWLSWGAAHLFGSEAPIVVRLPFIALFAGSTWLVYWLGVEVSDKRGGFWAAVLLNLSPVFGVTTGTWVLPDGPLDCALLGAALCLVRALQRDTFGWWVGVGLCAGLSLFAKYSAILTIGGAGFYLVSSGMHRHLLTGAKPWIAVAVAALVFSPVLVWNAGHSWVSFAFQGDRALGLHVRPFAPLVTLAGEALFVLPWIWLPMMAVVIAALRRGQAEWRRWLLCCLASPPIVAFALVAAWSNQRVMFHWAAPGYLMLFPLLGAAVAARIERPFVHRTVLATAALVVLAIGGVIAQVRWGWLHPLIAAVSRSDPTIEGIDWTSVPEQLAARDLLHPGTVIGVPDWRDAGKIAYALGPEVTTLCLSRDARQFGIAWPPGRYTGADVLILAPEHGDRVASELGRAFAGLEPLAPVAIRHDGRTMQMVPVFRARRLRVWPPPG